MKIQIKNLLSNILSNIFANFCCKCAKKLLILYKNFALTGWNKNIILLLYLCNPTVTMLITPSFGSNSENGTQNPDSRPRSEPVLELHSRAASSVAVMSLFQWSRHTKQSRRKVDIKKAMCVKNGYKAYTALSLTIFT